MISVIIPIYNAEKTLKRCLDSVATQSYQEFEVIMVNDGSKDGSQTICEEFVAHDSRFRLFYQPNGGVSKARNKGLDEAKGEFVAFVDSDDSVEPNYLKSLYEVIGNSDISIEGIKTLEAGEVVKIEHFEECRKPVTDLTSEEFQKVFHFCGPYCKLFKSDVVKRYDLRFPESISYGEDAAFYHEYLSHCKMMSFSSATAYLYTQNSGGSLSTTAHNPRRLWENQSRRRGAFTRLRKIFGLPDGFDQNENRCKLSGLKTIFSGVVNSSMDDSDLKSFIEEIKGDAGFAFMEIRPLTFKDKIMISLVKSNNRVSRSLLRRLI